MTTTVKTNDGIWTVLGFNFVSTDALYSIIQNAINNGLLNQTYLQNVSGCRAPIKIDSSKKTIEFASF